MLSFSNTFKGRLKPIKQELFVEVTDALTCKSVIKGKCIPLKGIHANTLPQDAILSFLFDRGRAILLHHDDFEILRKDWEQTNTRAVTPKKQPPSPKPEPSKAKPPSTKTTKFDPPSVAPPKKKRTVLKQALADKIKFPRRKEHWKWQEEAYGKWKAKKFRGTIEAATGTGKTYLGLDAIQCFQKIQKAHGKHPYCLIVVPSVYLLNQWYERLKAHFPGMRIARRGDGHKDTFAQGSICVATVQGLVGAGKKAENAQILKLFEFTKKDPMGNAILLVADECHHYTDEAPVFARVRTLIDYDAALALSATVERNAESPEFGKVIFSYSLAKAINMKTVLAPRVWNIPRSLQSRERNEYVRISDRIEKQRQKVIQTHPELWNADYADENFFSLLQQIDKDAGDGGDPSIRRLFSLYFQRASVLYMATEKQKAAGKLLKRLLAKRRKVLVFFERIASARESKASVDKALGLVAAVKKHSDQPIGTWVLHSEMSDEEKARSIKDFNDSASGALFCCNMVNEGYDLPDIEVALIVASTKSERQRVQRVGRIVRRGARNKKPLVLTLYCEGTSDAEIVKNDRSIFGRGVEISKKTVQAARSGISALYH